MSESCVIVVPCYNEANRLDAAAFLSYTQRVSDVRFLFVNDGSTDDTLAVLHRMQKHSGAISTIDLKPNGGKAAAVRVGLLEALRMPGATAVGYWDADLATPLEAIADLRQVLATNIAVEVVLGSRVKLLGRVIERSAVRHYLGRVFATFASLVLRLPVYDTQCGAKLFRAGPALSEVLAEPFMSRWIFDVELIARWQRHTLKDGKSIEGRIYEFPLHCWREIPGSKVKATDFLRAAYELYKIHMQNRRLLRLAGLPHGANAQGLSVKTPRGVQP